MSVPPSETDDEMRALLKDNLGWKAGGFGPHNMPRELMKGPENPFIPISVPAAAVRDGRINGAPRLNDFRRRFTHPYKDFMDMCGDAELAAQLAEWYPTVEDVELAVGCQVEKSMFGGWSLGNTVGLAIIADAFNSIRQDRFYTDDFNADVYTDWGLEHAKTTILTDIINRHLEMDLPRDMNLGRLPDWEGPPEWSEMAGFMKTSSFDARGFPIMK